MTEEGAYAKYKEWYAQIRVGVEEDEREENEMRDLLEDVLHRAEDMKEEIIRMKIETAKIKEALAEAEAALEAIRQNESVIT